MRREATVPSAASAWAALLGIVAVLLVPASLVGVIGGLSMGGDLLRAAAMLSAIVLLPLALVILATARAHAAWRNHDGKAAARWHAIQIAAVLWIVLSMAYAWWRG